MQKGISPYNGLVRLHYHSRQGRYELRNPEEQRGIDGVVDREEIGMGVDRHDNLLHRRVSCTFADTIDRNFHLSDSVDDSRKCIRSGES